MAPWCAGGHPPDAAALAAAGSAKHQAVEEAMDILVALENEFEIILKNQYANLYRFTYMKALDEEAQNALEDDARHLQIMQQAATYGQDQNRTVKIMLHVFGNFLQLMRREVELRRITRERHLLQIIGRVGTPPFDASFLQAEA
eukprot:6071435-Alexandrium_andersonii.AAC.1